jgi:hypothetical protein
MLAGQTAIHAYRHRIGNMALMPYAAPQTTIANPTRTR